MDSVLRQIDDFPNSLLSEFRDQEDLIKIFWALIQLEACQEELKPVLSKVVEQVDV